MAPPLIIAIDPGREKCGVAVLATSPVSVLLRQVVPAADLLPRLKALLSNHAGSEIVLGRGTGSDVIAQSVRAEFPDTRLHLVEERDTSRLARARYCRETPARGWRRLLPSGLRFPEEPYDDFVAVILAEEFLRNNRG